MKKLIYLFALLFLFGCEGHFTTWDDLNKQWLESNKVDLGTNSEVKEFEIMPSGIQYEVFHRGYGAVPKPDVDPSTGLASTVVVKYTGWLVDGTQFETNESVSLNLNECIPGWRDVLSLLPQGSHVKIYIPSEKGYGEEGSEDSKGNFRVPPHSTLIFDVELINVINY